MVFWCWSDLFKTDSFSELVILLHLKPVKLLSMLEESTIMPGNVMITIRSRCCGIEIQQRKEPWYGRFVVANAPLKSAHFLFMTYQTSTPKAAAKKKFVVKALMPNVSCVTRANHGE